MARVIPHVTAQKRPLWLLQERLAKSKNHTAALHRPLSSYLCTLWTYTNLRLRARVEICHIRFSNFCVIIFRFFFFFFFQNGLAPWRRKRIVYFLHEIAVRGMEVCIVRTVFFLHDPKRIYQLNSASHSTDRRHFIQCSAFTDDEYQTGCNLLNALLHSWRTFAHPAARRCTAQCGLPLARAAGPAGLESEVYKVARHSGNLPISCVSHEVFF